MRLINLTPKQGASTEGVRDHNKRIVLNLIRKKQPISRADLARLTGLQRSTISLIVDEVIEDQLVVEGTTGRLPRGRRPTFLQMNDTRVAIGIDIRPTKTALALVNINGIFLAQESWPTPESPEMLIQQLIERVPMIVRDHPGRSFEGIGISVPGRISEKTGHLVFAPNLGWAEVDLAGPLHAATGLEIEIENAATASVLSAVSFGGFDTCTNLVAVTVSEGIGTGIFIDSILARGMNGMAGEFGHVPVDPNGPLCNCGGHGCWELYASNRAALRYYADLGGRPDPDMTFSALLSLADQGDQPAQKALEKMAYALGRGMRMIVAGLAPETILVVGDLTQSWHRFASILQAQVQAQTLGGGSPPQVLPAQEDGMGRLRGTVALVFQKHFGFREKLPA